MNTLTFDEQVALLLKDLCARLPYKVMVHIRYNTKEPCYGELTPKDIQWFIDSKIKEIKTYLRPMSSMTEEERKELEKITYHTFEYKKGERDIWTKSYYKNYLFNGAGKLYGAGEPINMLCSSELCTKLIDWLNMHHFDYRHLIERGLALEAKEGMYKK